MTQRPSVLALAAAGGAASVGGIALPGRCDEVIRVAVVRRCRRRTASFGAVALSIFLLGLLDSVAMTPLASVAFAVGHVGGWLQVGLGVVAVAGVAAAAVVLFLPRLAAGRFVSRFRVSGWVRDNATPPREAAWAGLAVATSWVLRTLAIFVLLAALGLGTNFALALAFVCASAASAVLPVAPAGAAMQAGAGAAILVASGVRTRGGGRLRHRRAGARHLRRRGVRRRPRRLARAGPARGRAPQTQQVAVAWQVRSTRTDGVPACHVSRMRTDAALLS